MKKKFNDFKVKADKAKSLFQLFKSKGDPIMFPDVHLPKSMSIGERIDNILQNQISTNIEIVTYVLEGEIEQSLDIDLDDVLPGALEGLDSTLDTPSLYGMPKPSKGKEWPRSSQIRGVYPTMINRLIKVEMDDADPAEGYFYFGNGNYLEILPKMLQSNPFWASALSVSGDNDEYIELTTDDKTSKYSIILDTMQEKVQSRFVNVRFNRDMTINQITNKGEVVPEEDWNYYASAACYNVYCKLFAIMFLTYFWGMKFLTLCSFVDIFSFSLFSASPCIDSCASLSDVRGDHFKHRRESRCVY